MTRLGEALPGRGAAQPGGARRGGEASSASPTRSPVSPAVLRLSTTLRGLARASSASSASSAPEGAGAADWQRLSGELRQAWAALPSGLFTPKERRAIEKLLAAPPFAQPGPMSQATASQAPRERGLVALMTALRALPSGRDAAMLPERFALAATLHAGAKPPPGGTQALQSVFATFTDFAARFASLMPPDRPAAAWAKALAGARSAPAGEERPRLSARFLEVLRSLGFAQAVDQSGPRAALDAAAALLAAPSAQAVRALAAEVRLGPSGPPPEAPDAGRAQGTAGEPGADAARSDAPSTFEATSGARDGGVAPLPGGRPSAEPARPRGPEERPPAAPEDEERRRGPRKLGPNVVWNFLHGFRDSDEAGREAERADGTESLGRLVFTALLVLCGGALLVIVLASL